MLEGLGVDSGGQKKKKAKVSQKRCSRWGQLWRSKTKRGAGPAGFEILDSLPI